MEYLLSAGIDIGTTTTHLVISRIGIAVERGWGTVPKAEIKEKTILYQSPIYFTPLADGQIDLPRVQTIIHMELEKAGTTPGALNTGAVILTGESVKKRNARRVAGTVADGMGDFVVASAGPRLERPPEAPVQTRCLQPATVRCCTRTLAAAQRIWRFLTTGRCKTPLVWRSAVATGEQTKGS